MVQCTGTLFVSERFLCFSSLPFPIAPSHDEIGTMVVLYARKITAIEFLHTGKLIVSTKNRVVRVRWLAVPLTLAPETDAFAPMVQFTFANLDTSRGSAYKTASRLWKRKWAVASSVSDIPTYAAASWNLPPGHPSILHQSDSHSSPDDDDAGNCARRT